MEKSNDSKIAYLGNSRRTPSFLSAMTLYLSMHEHLYTPVESFSDNKSNIPKMWNYAPQSKDYKFDKDGVAEKLVDVGRNESCLCGSGKNYKKCCLNKRD